MGPIYCCKLRTFVIFLGCVFLLSQLCLLVLSFLMMKDIESHVTTAMTWFKSVTDPTGGPNTGEEFFQLRETVVRVSASMPYSKGGKNNVSVNPIFLEIFFQNPSDIQSCSLKN